MEKERERECACVCEGEREKQWGECVYVCESVCMSVCVLGGRSNDVRKTNLSCCGLISFPDLTGSSPQQVGIAT